MNSSSSDSFAGIRLLAPFTRVTENFSTVACAGDFGFDRFLAEGGADTEDGTYDFIRRILNSPEGLRFCVEGMGCSTMQARSRDGYLFGRNFDWGDCPLLMLTAFPEDGYASYSSVNPDFVSKRSGPLEPSKLPIAAYYAPLDGMNQQGVCISVNLLPDGMELKQSTGKPHLTITTAIRLLLDKAATTDEALNLLRQYDLSTTTGLTVHYLISDAKGRSVCVEYIHNQMSVVETAVMTNHYLTPGPYFGQARNNSIERYGILSDYLASTPVSEVGEVFSAMAKVFHGTQWTAVYDQSALTARVCHRDSYGAPITLTPTLSREKTVF